MDELVHGQSKLDCQTRECVSPAGRQGSRRDPAADARRAGARLPMRSDLAVPAAWQCFRYATAPCPCGIKKSRPHRAAGRLWTIVFLFSEVIVHTGAHQAEPVTVRRAGDDEVAVGEIDIEIFDLGAPVRRKTHL